ncbi:MAG TPA: hypothetical protein DDX19_26295 [Rhodopirellula baltica]|nr:hypothetical protein [Rhodopirellula baltica]
MRSCRFTSPSLWEGRTVSGRGGLRAGFNAEPSPRFARPSQGEGDDNAWQYDNLESATSVAGGAERDRAARIPGRTMHSVSHIRPSLSRTPERRRATSP